MHSATSPSPSPSLPLSCSPPISLFNFNSLSPSSSLSSALDGHTNLTKLNIAANFIRDPKELHNLSRLRQIKVCISHSPLSSSSTSLANPPTLSLALHSRSTHTSHLSPVFLSIPTETLS